MGNPRVGAVAESTAVSVAESTDVNSDDVQSETVFGRALGKFTGDGVGSMFRAIPDLERLVLTEVLTRLTTVITIKGVDYSVKQAANAFRQLHKLGVAKGKAVCSQLPSWSKDDDSVPAVIDEELYELFIVNQGYVDVKTDENGERNYVGVPCLLKKADVAVYEGIDEAFLELGLNRSRRGSKGYWSEDDIDELVEDIKTRLAELN
jgi:hypothetical protein